MNADECILLAILDENFDADPLAGKEVFEVADANADVETRELMLFVRVAKADGLSDGTMAMAEVGFCHDRHVSQRTNSSVSICAPRRCERESSARTVVLDLVCCKRCLGRAVLFKFRWAFGDKDVEELIDVVEVDVGNADVTRASEWGVNEGDVTTIFCTCRSISSQPSPSFQINEHERNTSYIPIAKGKP